MGIGSRAHTTEADRIRATGLVAAVRHGSNELFDKIEREAYDDFGGVSRLLRVLAARVIEAHDATPQVSEPLKVSEPVDALFRTAGD